MKKILILYTSVGLGHRSIALNITQRLESAGFEVRMEDILQVEAGPLVNIGKAFHHFINFHLPFLWSFLYKSEKFTDWSLKFRTRVASKHALNTQMVFDSFEPDAVIATQTTASAVVSYLKSIGKYNKLFGIAFSDFHLHRYWLYDNCDFYIANTSEQKEQMAQMGVEANKIFVCGMSMPPPPSIDTTEVRNKLGVLASDKVVLLSGGSLGYGLDRNMILSLSSRPNLKIILICGKNQKAFRALSDYFFGRQNILVLGFYQPMDELYSIADIFITKPGGLSVSEALSWQLPVLISHFLPGQEELNYEYLQDKAVVMPEPINLESDMAEELEGNSFRSSLKTNPYVHELLFGKELVEDVVKDLLHGK